MPDLRDSITAEFRETKKQIDALKAEAQKRAKTTFGAGAERLFEAHPVLQNFGWNQYTPFFCDGDPCEFGVNDLEINICTEEADLFNVENLQIAQHIDDIPGSWFGEYAHPYFSWGDENRVRKERGWGSNATLNPNYDPVYAEAAEAADAFRNIFDEDDLKDLFGDHTSVLVTRNGVETTDCEHE